MKKSGTARSDDLFVRSNAFRLFFFGTLICTIGVIAVAVRVTPSDRSLDWRWVLPVLVVGAAISGRRTTTAGIHRDGRDVILSPIGQFMFAGEMLLPPLALIPLAFLVPASRPHPESWTNRGQRTITMLVGSMTFWNIADTANPLLDNPYRTVIACLAAMTCHTLVEAALVSARVSITNGDRATDSVVWTPYAALRDVWELAIGAVGALLALQHPVLAVVAIPMCCLASEHIRLESQSRLALTDSRTGLLNPRGFALVAEHEWARADRGSTRISLVLVDLDLLREVNNVHGHRAGDAVISTVGHILASCSRGSDAVARLGGEEFAILLPDSDITSATRVAERLREAVECAVIDTPAGPLRVTVSCGIATRVGSEPMEALFDRADTALYSAKNGGRNRVAIAERENDATRVARRDHAA